jgi:hypothetical protein
MLKKSSPLKQLGQMEPNLAGSIYGGFAPGFVNYKQEAQHTEPVLLT